MKAILEFNLPEDNNEYKITTKASDFYLALYDISNSIRSFEKYELGIDPPETQEEMEEWSKRISRLINEIWSKSNEMIRDIE